MYATAKGASLKSKKVKNIMYLSYFSHTLGWHCTCGYTCYPLANIVVGFVDPYPEAGNLVNCDGLNKCLPLAALCRPEIKQSHKNLTLAGLPTIRTRQVDGVLFVLW